MWVFFVMCFKKKMVDSRLKILRKKWIFVDYVIEIFLSIFYFNFILGKK